MQVLKEAQPKPRAKPKPRVDAPPLSPYRAALRMYHRTVFDRADNHLERVSTAVETPLDDFKIVGRNRAQAHGYRPTPRRLIGWVLDSLPGPFDHTTFVDIGSGRGRVLLEAARYPFQHIVGIESAEELHEDCLLNLRHWPRGIMRCREVDPVLGDALKAPLPKGDLVVWMFDPFSDQLMTRMAARLAEHAQRWSVTLILVDARNPMAFRESAAFKAVEPPPALRRQLALYSPYTVSIFTTGGK